jgi:hypothetical protein
MAIKIVSSREALSGSYGPRSAFPAGKYFLFNALLRRKGGLTFARIEGRAFAPSRESAYGIIRADLGQDFADEDIKIRLDEIPPIAMFVTYQRPADKLEWEEFKDAEHGSGASGGPVNLAGDYSLGRSAQAKVGFHTEGEPPFEFHSDPQRA